MKKKNLIVVGIIAVVALIGVGAFVATRNNGSDDTEPLATVQELPELETQEVEPVETVEAEPEVIEEEVKVDETAAAEPTEEEPEVIEEEVEEPTESIVAVEPSESDKTNNAQPDVDYRVPDDFTYADGYWVDESGYKYVHVDNHWEDEYGNRIYMEGYEEGIEHIDVPNNGEGKDIPEEYLEMLQSIKWE